MSSAIRERVGLSVKRQHMSWDLKKWRSQHGEAKGRVLWRGNSTCKIYEEGMNVTCLKWKRKPWSDMKCQERQGVHLEPCRSPSKCPGDLKSIFKKVLTWCNCFFKISILFYFFILKYFRLTEKSTRFTNCFLFVCLDSPIVNVCFIALLLCVHIIIFLNYLKVNSRYYDPLPLNILEETLGNHSTVV